MVDYQKIYNKIYKIVADLKKLGALRFASSIRANEDTLAQLREKDEVFACGVCGDPFGYLTFPTGEREEVRCVGCAD